MLAEVLRRMNEKEEIIRDRLLPRLSTLAITQIELLTGWGQPGRQLEMLCRSGGVGPHWSSGVDNMHQGALARSLPGW